MGEAFTRKASGTNILPIPPTLEFPFPETRPDSTVPGLENVTKTNSTPSTHQVAAARATAPTKHGAIPESKTLATPSLANVSPEPSPRPRRRRLKTERPAYATRSSLLGGPRIGQSGFVLTPANKSAKKHSESSTSGDEESKDDMELTSTPSQLSGRSSYAKNKSRAQPRKGCQRESDAHFRKFAVGNDNYKTKGRVSKRDGRLKISVNETNNRGYLAHALGATLRRHLTHTGEDQKTDNQTLSPIQTAQEPKRPDLTAKLSCLSQHTKLDRRAPKPRLNIVIMVIGSRGDIQPFLKIGKLLKENYGHRVRIATHPAFKTFVEQDSGLEFFSVGGDPAELMAFMVKNPGLMPSTSTIKAGEIGRRRDAMFEMFLGFWRACINSTDDETDKANLKMMGGKHPFVADAIIANPPCFAHIHCAERLGVPLHLMFTFPYSPTQQFPHPLANIKNSNVNTNYTNFMSYPLVEMMTWQGLGDLVNRFRVKTLGLEPVSTLWAPGQLYRLRVPYTYMWSPSLIPKPADWGPEIDIAGFVFLDLASSFKPPETLARFLDAEEPPVYIGFGSIVVDDPDNFTSLIFEAVEKAGVRALVSKGWGGLGDESNVPDNIYMLENTPHDWLFPRISAVVHHGGAGTTAIGLKCGKPTMIVPFFGDQSFWGAMVANASAGAHSAIPYKRLTVDKLADGIKQCLSLEAKEAAEELAKNIAEEGDGAKNALESFHGHLPMAGEQSMRCSILPDRVAVWLLKRFNLKLSALAAELLVEKKRITWKELKLVRHYEWNDFEGPGEPITGAGAAFTHSVGGIFKGVGGVPVRWARSFKKKERRVQKEKKRRASSGARKSKQKKPPLANQQVEEPRQSLPYEDEESGELTHSGQHGAEEHLPEAHGVPHDTAEGPLGGKSQGRLAPTTGILHSAPIHTQLGHFSDNDISPNIHPEASSENLAQDLILDTTTGFAKSGAAFAKLPMDLSLAIAQGFHNAPRLYGDSTVRTPPRISGIHSGLKAAGSEFTLGIYDGVTGLVRQPYDGAKRDGALGFVKGFGKGVGGFVLKDIAAVVGPFGFAAKGLHKEIVKGRQPTAFIRRARIIQGQKDAAALDERDRRDVDAKIDAAWRVVSEIGHEADLQREEGLRGRLSVARERREWTRNGAFENMGEARRALVVKQEERRERGVWGENHGAGRGSGEVVRLGRRDGGGEKEARSDMEEKRTGRFFAKRGDSLLKTRLRSVSPNRSEILGGKPRRAVKTVGREVLDMRMECGEPRPETGLADGMANVAA